MGEPSLHQRLLCVAESQHGVVGRAALIEGGFSPAAIDHARRARRLCPVFRSSYAVGREVETATGVWQAATITAGTGSVLMGRSAAELWGMRRLPHGLPKIVEVGRPPGRRTRSMPGFGRVRDTTLHVRQRSFRPGEVARKDGIPVTSPMRTQIDLAGSVGARELTSSFTEACRLRLIGRRDLAALVERSRNRPGSGRLRRLAELWVPELERTRSPLEGRFLLHWSGRDSRIPEVNVSLGIWEVDFLWRAEKLVVEMDGRAYHDNDIARNRDRRKTHWLESEGYTVLRFGESDVTGDAEAMCETVRRHLDDASRASTRR